MPVMNTLAETQSAVITDDAFGERVLISPLHKGIADPSRQPAEVVGVLRTRPGKSENLAGGRAQSWSATLDGSVSALAVDGARYPDLVVRRGDAVRALERRGQPWFEVDRIDDRGAPRLVFEFTEG